MGATTIPKILRPPLSNADRFELELRRDGTSDYVTEALNLAGVALLLGLVAAVTFLILRLTGVVP